MLWDHLDSENTVHESVFCDSISSLRFFYLFKNVASRITLRKVAQDHVLQNRVLKKCIATLKCIVILRIFNGGNL